MTLRFDPQERTLELGVRELIQEDPLLRRRGPTGAGMVARMAMGSRAHREVQEARLRGAAEYLSEVPVRRELEVAGYRVIVQGRVDGVLRSADGSLLVEEIKSVALPPPRFREDELAPRREHRLQLEIYCALLAEPGRPVRGLLTLYNLVDGARLEILIEVDPAAAMDEIHRRIAAILRRLEDEAERLAARAGWAERLVFPFPVPRPHQQEMVAALEEAWERGRDVLLSAPSGTGKTAAALFAALHQAFRRRLRVFFVTAKNTQQKLAAETLEELARASEVPLRALVLRAKERMCLGDEQLCGEEICPWLEDYAERAERWGLPSRLLDRPVVHPEAIIAAAREAKICPFEVSLDLLPLVDVVVGDYNYVFDPSVSLSCFQEGTARDVLLVVDEAHNLLERGRDYYSPALERRQVEDALRLLAGGDPAQPVLAGDFGVRPFSAGGGGARRRLAGLLAEVGALLDVVRASVDPGDGRPFEALVELVPEPLEHLRARLERAHLEYLIQSREAEPGGGEETVARLVADFGRFASVAALRGTEFVRFYRRRGDGSEQLKILCLDPAKPLGRRLRGLAGTAAMSATLEPADFYRRSLGFRKTRTALCSFPSPFPAANRLVLVLPEVTTLYRQREANYEPIARLVGEIAGLRPGNYLAFFPSFDFLERVAGRIAPPGFRVIRQAREMRLEERAEVLARLAAADEPHLVLAVQGGIFAEGVDYPGEMAVGVIVVGPGLPQVNFERELIRRHFDEVEEAGFEFAYLYPGMNRSVQAAGRLIRTPEDRGVIAFLDRRFAGQRYAACLPPHWYDESPRELVIRRWREAIAAFWEGVG